MAIENKIQEVLDLFQEETLKTENAIYRGLVEELRPNRIPESLFVNYFLPCFIGEVDRANWVLEWISIAGTPMSEVEVFDDRTNETLYVVPSILNSNNILLPNENGNMIDIFSRFEQMKNNIPVNSLAFLISALNEKSENIAKIVNNSDVAQKWYFILKRYNLVKENIQQEENRQLNLFDFDE